MLLKNVSFLRAKRAIYYYFSSFYCYVIARALEKARNHNQYIFERTLLRNKHEK